MTKNTNAVGFCLLKLLMAARFSPAHTEPRKMADTTAMAVNIPRGFRNLQGSDRAVSLNPHARTHRPVNWRDLVVTCCYYNTRNPNIFVFIWYMTLVLAERSYFLFISLCVTVYMKITSNKIKQQYRLAVVYSTGRCAVRSINDVILYWQPNHGLFFFLKPQVTRFSLTVKYPLVQQLSSSLEGLNDYENNMSSHRSEQGITIFSKMSFSWNKVAAKANIFPTCKPSWVRPPCLENQETTTNGAFNWN